MKVSDNRPPSPIFWTLAVIIDKYYLINMKKIYFLIIINFFGIVSAQNPEYKKSIDSLMNYFQENNAFSGVVMLQKNGEIIYNGNYNKLPNNSDLYRIGSITKVFTSIIIFQLIDEGKLSLDTKLYLYFPTIKNADKITIGNMLNHTSGIYDYLSWESYYSKKEDNYTRENLLKLVSQGKPEFKPGQDSSYSNSNYLLLGYIIEEITGKSFAENLNSRIIGKIGLSNTYLETSEKEYSKRNFSYNFDGENWSKEKETNPSFTLSAGGMVSTANDLSKLMKNLFDGNLVSKNSLEQMEKTNSKTWIGYGLFKAPFYKKMGYGHSGRVDEFHSFTGYFPEDNLSIAILSNGGNIKLNEVVLGIASKYYEKKYNYPDFTTFKSEKATPTENYVGEYKAQLAGIITVGRFQITQAGKDHLFVMELGKGGNSEKALLERKGENAFYGRKFNSNFDFILDKNGKVTGIQMTQGKQSIKCKKVA